MLLRHRFSSLTVVITVGGVLALAATGVRAQNIVLNPSFEQPVNGPGSLIVGSIPNWTSDGQFEIQGANFLTPADGTQFLELDVFNNTTISQTLTTTAGATYNLSFAIAARPGTGTPSNGFNVFFNSIKLNEATLFATDGAGFTQVNFFGLAATSTSTVLSFQGAGTSDGLGSYLDAVSVVAATSAPEPGAAALLAVVGGPMFLGMVAQRRRRRSAE